MRMIVIVPAALFIVTTSAVAGDVSGKGPNGGRLADAGNMHAEFVSKGVELFVYTYDHDNKPVPSAGMSGKATIQEKGKTRSAELKPQEANRLVGKLDAPLEAGARVIVSLTPQGGKPVQARYTAN